MSAPAAIFPIMIDYRFRDRVTGGADQIRAAGGCFAVVGVPWGMIEPHEAQAQKNHGQTLKRLAERGGLSACEAVAVLTDRGYYAVPASERTGAAANRKLVELLLGAGLLP